MICTKHGDLDRLTARSRVSSRLQFVVKLRVRPGVRHPLFAAVYPQSCMPDVRRNANRRPGIFMYDADAGVTCWERSLYISGK